MNGGRFHVWSRVSDYRNRREIMLFMKYPDGSECVAEPFVFKDSTNQLVEKPTIGDAYGDAFLQAILDHAWEVGLRPRGFSDVPLQVAALKAHLSDMRALAFIGKLPALVPPTHLSDLDFETPPGFKRD